MGRLAAFVFAAIPMSPASARALKATIADWRHETAGTPHLVARTVVAVRSTLALLRVLVGSALREFPAEARSPFLWRVAIGSVMTVGAVGLIEPMYPTVAKGVGAFTLMSLAQGLYLGAMFLPLVVFAAQ